MFYDSNRISGLGSINVEPDTRFCHEHAAMQAVIESQQNELIMFENNITVDFQEATMIHEGATIETLEELHENVITSIFKHIGDLFMKLWAKIKAIFKSFITKFDSVFMKSNRDFITKYRNQTSEKNFDGITIKYNKPNNVDFVIRTALSVGLTNQEQQSKKLIKQSFENYDSEEQEKYYIKKFTGMTGVTLEEFDKQYHTHCYESESEEDLTETLVNEAIRTLEGSDCILSAIKDANSILEKSINNIIKQINIEEKKYKEASKNANPDVYTSYDTNDGESDVVNKDRDYKSAKNSTTVYDDQIKENKKILFKLLARRASCLQTCISRVTAGAIREAKFGASQARRVIVKAVNAKTINNEATLLNAIEDSAAYEAELELH